MRSWSWCIMATVGTAALLPIPIHAVEYDGLIPTGQSNPHSSTAEVQLAPCFGSHMVLQQGIPMSVWGKAPPAADITVSLGADSQTTQADASGRWRVTLPPQRVSSEPRSLVIKSGDQTVTLDDVLVGDVWLCAGQSNMLMPLARAADAAREITRARQPLLRLFHLTPAAGGDGGGYPPETIMALEPTKYATGRWAACTPESAASFSAVAYFFGERLLDAREVPVGVMCIAAGGTPTEAWVSSEALAANPETRPLIAGDWLDNAALDGWCKDRARENLGRALRAGERVPGDETGPNHPFKPGFMWEAAVAPVAPFAIRGVVWYQGESNADSATRVEQHDHIFPQLVADWRRAWADDALPFAMVQLPGMNRPDWPAFRDRQRRLAEAIPGIGLIVTIDLGDPRDVHPRDKRPVGERAAAWALSAVYGHDGPATGPLPISADQTASGTIVIRFKETGGQLTTTDGKSPCHFEMAGEDGVFTPAESQIEGETVILSVPSGRPPGSICRVRHAWRPFPQPAVNLTGTTGLPATPFQLSVSHQPQE